MFPSSQLDPAALERLLQLGGRKFADEMTALFLDYVGKKVAEARAAVAVGNLDAVRRAVHSIRSSAGNVGAARVQEWATRLESEARDGHAEAVAAGLPELERAFAAASGELLAARSAQPPDLPQPVPPGG